MVNGVQPYQPNLDTQDTSNHRATPEPNRYATSVQERPDDLLKPAEAAHESAKPGPQASNSGRQIGTMLDILV